MCSESAPDKIAVMITWKKKSKMNCKPKLRKLIIEILLYI